MMMRDDISRQMRDAGLTLEEFIRLRKEVGNELVKEMYPGLADNDN